MNLDRVFSHWPQIRADSVKINNKFSDDKQQYTTEPSSH
jgi:hypothetical protein